MNKYVVIISIGPVQSMIASARKSRDLWSGSWLLSELAKSCAKFFYDLNSKKVAGELGLSDIQIDNDKRVELIFPYMEDDGLLSPNSNFSVGNKLQTVIQAKNKDELEKILNQAKQAVQQRYRTEADNALSQLNEDDIRFDIWQSQIDDVLEIQYAWVKIENDDYYNASKKAGEVLASRKATRDFKQATYCKDNDCNKLVIVEPFTKHLMIPKSSLDGFRETVLKENTEKQNNPTRKKLSLAQSEQLDVLGVVKRLGFKDKAEQFTPISRVMADAWIENVSEDELEPIREICENLVRLEVITRVKGNKGIYQKFPYDAQLLYRSRLDAEISDYEKAQNLSNGSEEKKEIEEIIQYLKKLKNLLNDEKLKKYGEPYRYGALLLADGDRMGELLDKAQTQKQHQDITKALSAFAGGVAEIMRNNRGHCIYAGGDDVLGLVPLHLAQQCADKLQQEFAKCLKQVADELKADKKPTLSVGLAICHLITPFGVFRELAGQAEKYAKGDHIALTDEKENHERRNALGILLSVRSGSDIKLRFNWSDTDGLDDFDEFKTYYQNKSIPSRVAYDIREIFIRTKHFAPNDSQLKTDIQSAELVRMLKKARTDKGEKIDEKIIIKLEVRGKSVGLEQLANELIVARWLAAKLQNDLGKE